MSETKKLFLLDAYALIFRAYYAFINRPIRNSRGLNTSAIFGFVNTLDEVLKKDQPSHIAICFDPPAPTFRHTMFPEYKANREATPPDIKLSVPYIKQIIEAYGIPSLEISGFEADDVVGTVAKRARKEGFEVYMMTPDKDYAQLVEEGIYMYKPRRSGNDIEILGVEEVKEKFQIQNPLQVIDILALWGDTSDNVPGAPGIGEKTAQKLIADYGSVEGLLQHTAELKGKQKENIESHIEQIKLSKQLVTIDTQVPMSLRMDDLLRKEPNNGALKKLFTELEFRTLLTRFETHVPRETFTQASLFDLPETPKSAPEVIQSYDSQNVKYQLITTESQVMELVNELLQVKVFCFDTETTGLDVLSDRLVGLALASEKGKAWYIAFTGSDEATRATLSKLQPLFANESIIKVAHNLKFDTQVLRRYQLEVKAPHFDTMVAHYLLHPEGRHKLDVLAEDILNYRMVPIEQLIGKKGKNQLTMNEVSLEQQCSYACEDADITLQLYTLFKDQLVEKQLDSTFYNLDMPLVEVLAEMELRGVTIQTNTLEKYSQELEKEIVEVEQRIYELASETFNIASPRQLGIILFEKLQLSAAAKMTKTKQYATSEEVLSRLIDVHPIVEQILTYRSLTKLQSTYVSALPKMIHPVSGRIHTSFNQTIAATGRLSSINPNLQNIPIREERGREIRKAFVPCDTEHILLAADYSQIELRLMAHMSQDPHMVEAFRTGADIHRATAAKVYKVTEEQVDREMRSKAKTANFGIIYGISAFGLSQRLRIPRNEAKELIDSYFDSFPKVKQYMDECVEKAKSQGFVTTLYGRKRWLPDIVSANSIVRGVAERNAINSPIQGTAADIIKLAMIGIQKRLGSVYRSRMILQVHDELVFDVYQPELDAIKQLVKEEMEGVASLLVPLEVEMGTGTNWLEAH